MVANIECMSTIRFVLRKDKPIKKGDQEKQLYPIQLVYQISGNRKYYNTGQAVEENAWDSASQSVIIVGKSKEAKVATSINLELNELRSKIEKIENKYQALEQEYSTETIINELTAQKKSFEKKTAPKNAVYDLLDRFIEYKAATQKSAAVYSQLKEHIKDFEKAKSEKISFENMDEFFLDKFQGFLTTSRKKIVPGKLGTLREKQIRMRNTTAFKQVSSLKSFLVFAKKKGAPVNESYSDFEIPRYEKEVVALTPEEFDRVVNLDLSGNRRLDEARDIFVFSCATGLRYSDLAQLDRSHIKDGEISFRVQKTAQPLIITLNQYSQSILDKYKDRFKPLPVKANQRLISDQKLNKALKGHVIYDKYTRQEIGYNINCVFWRAGLTHIEKTVSYYGKKAEDTITPRFKRITTHIGRKTFVTLSLTKRDGRENMSAEEVMAFTGHKDYRSFQRYVKVTDQRKREAMKNAWGDIKPKMQVV